MISRAVYLYCVAILAVTGNVTVLLTILSHHRLRTLHRCFIISLASADLLFALTEVWPYATKEFYDHQWIPPHHVVCVIQHISGPFCGSASIFTQTALAINRYKLISNPLTYNQNMSLRRALVELSIAWMCAFIMGFPPLTWRPWAEICGQESYDSNPLAEILYMISEYAFMFIIPFIILCVVYSMIGRIARLHVLRIHIQEAVVNQTLGVQNENIARPSFSRDLKTVKMLVVISGLFFVTWFPFFTVLIVFKFWPDKVSHDTLNGFLYFMFCNCVLNPVLYTLWDKELRSTFKGYLGRCPFSKT